MTQPASRGANNALGPPLRVRTGSDHMPHFTVHHGQRNARFVARRLTPLKRIWGAADAFALVPEHDWDIVHATNAVPLLTRRPYVLTFEDYLPRVPEDRHVAWLERSLRRQLLQPRCVALLAMSEYAVRQFRAQNASFPRRAELERKLEVLRPALPLRREQPKGPPRDRLRLLFTGRDFMRKGGPAVLAAHALLRERGVPVETTIVSSLRWSAEDYIGPPSAAVVERAVAQLGQDGVVHRAELPNGEVLRLMDEADFFVFPTLHDTFGFVALEALAGGTPVIASAVNALPEVVDDDRCGYLVPLETDGELGRWAWTYRNAEPGYVTAYEDATRDLGRAIADRLSDCWETRGTYERLSAGAIEQVRARFDVETARDRLEQLYERCREHLPRRRSSAPGTSA